MKRWDLVIGDCVEALAAMPADSIDAIVTDPPYGLGFMGKAWDRPGASFVERKPDKRNRFDHVGGNHNPTSSADAARTRAVENRRAQEWHEAWAREAFRVAKPGAHLLAFGGTRTFHRLACAIEDAGWEIRDCLSWMYGQGFPKSLDVSKAIDKAAGFERARVPGGVGSSNTASLGKFKPGEAISGEAISEDARRWQGWGTALKPAWEPIILARKPLSEGTVVANVLAHGTGAINIDGCRIGSTVETWPKSQSYHANRGPKPRAAHGSGKGETQRTGPPPPGRWPANVALDEAAAAMLDEQTGTLKSGTGAVIRKTGKGYRRNALGVESRPEGTPILSYGDEGGASRFFFTAKASSGERNIGNADNRHPTVKPVDLMRWLVRLVTPPGGVVLDPFAGSGTTLVAALREGFRCIGVEREADYAEIARARIWGDAPLLRAIDDAEVAR